MIRNLRAPMDCPYKCIEGIYMERHEQAGGLGYCPSDMALSA